MLCSPFIEGKLIDQSNKCLVIYSTLQGENTTATWEHSDNIKGNRVKYKKKMRVRTQKDEDKRRRKRKRRKRNKKEPQPYS